MPHPKPVRAMLDQSDFRNALGYFQEGNGPSTPAEKNASNHPAGL
jgi:hypothetical protein